MIVIPNLFGAYQKGREAAIEANWNDLKNYENIEAMRTRNDREALQLLADQADYNINRSMMRDNGDVSAMATALTRERFPGDVYNARNQNMLGQAQYIAATNAAADGRLQNYANGQLMTTFNNGGTNLYNSGVNSIDAATRYNGLNTHRDAYGRLVADTVADNIAAGQQVLRTNQATRPSNHAAAVDNAATTANRARAAALFSGGQLANPAAITQAGVNATEANLTATELTNANTQYALDQARKLPEEERKARLSQLLNQRTLILQNIRLAAQSGDTATVDALAAQFGNIDAAIESLGGKSQIGLVRESVLNALGAVPPSTATTQVSPTPATQTPAVQPASMQPPVQVPSQLLPEQPQPSFTPNGAPVGHPAYRPQQGAWGNVPLTRPVPGLWQPQHARQPVGAWTLQGTNK